MLVLSRKPGERICIGGGICVTVVTIRGQGVRLGIEAPAHVPIVREELLPRTPGSGPSEETGRTGRPSRDPDGPPVEPRRTARGRYPRPGHPAGEDRAGPDAASGGEPAGH